MRPWRTLAASAAATVVFFIYGFLVHGTLIARDYIPYPVGVYRSGDDAKAHVLVSLAGLFTAILVFMVIFQKIGHGVAAGLRLGVLFGVFMAGAFAAVNYGTLHISGKLALEIALSEPVEWSLVGLVAGYVLKPPAVRA